eukprot:CAMPEP_0170561892 /NCGR_PEP_ID=MMETSP0211-20121228/57546_1 /TAXON_ID=311385 /ORGANISM="Pseudokeronopsis sp., Strain OXSARD2" /LENGTH=72 /DNA_ID=CAMNT_0010878023 /DNA_START=721 /DNA_END=939 /DNA_ORIENTATION=+
MKGLGYNSILSNKLAQHYLEFNVKAEGDFVMQEPRFQKKIGMTTYDLASEQEGRFTTVSTATHQQNKSLGRP